MVTELEWHIILNGLRVNNVPIPATPRNGRKLGGHSAHAESYSGVRRNVMILEEALGIRVKVKHKCGKRLAGIVVQREQ